MKHRTKWVLMITGLTILLVLAIVQTVFFKPREEAYISYNGVEVSWEDYKNIKNKFGDYVGITICDIDDLKCIRLTDIDNYLTFRSGN